MRDDHIQNNIRKYYDEKIEAYGSTPRGVDWNSSDSQKIRFEQLLKGFITTEPFSINDYGCGYGALIDFMKGKGYRFNYLGYDISGQMIAKGRELNAGDTNCQFTTNPSQLYEADFTVASGIFNVRLRTNPEEWVKYLLQTLSHIANLSKYGFAFNVLTKYSDPKFMRSDLYYADPLFLFDYCMKNFSKHVALLHDYPLYEFTILVK